ncbi:MAG: acyl-CoA dehydrogenase, partial [Rhodospirillaceae bacterium]|nr:acyl-CoA dehydrogenase [Rhodospirillaceae bacterium]
MVMQTSNEDEKLILSTVERFLERDVVPYALELEHNDTWPEEIVAKMSELGLFGSIIQTEYGGLGLSCSTYAK